MKVTTFSDGDIMVTTENLVFYTFGYVHPKDIVITYLKYVSKKFRPLFPLDFQKTEWEIEGQKLIRPKELYTPENFRRILEAFHDHFPSYLYSCPYIGKTLMAVPIKSVKKIYRPQESLQRLLQGRRLDSLESLAIKLIKLLSEASSVPLEDFGIHGSIAMNMHSQFSDIDVAVYGANNFLQVRSEVEGLVKRGWARHLFEDKIDELRRNKGRFEGTKFVFNAVRKVDEINEKYGQYRYQALRRLSFMCRISEDWESHFKPAIYGITGYKPLGADSELNSGEEPVELVSMIGRYRGITRKNQVVKAVGMLERVTNTENSSVKHRIVVGSIGANEEEYLWPVTG